MLNERIMDSGEFYHTAATNDITPGSLEYITDTSLNSSHLII